MDSQEEQPLVNRVGTTRRVGIGKPSNSNQSPLKI